MIDERLGDLGISIVRTNNPPAEGYWRLTTARWYNEEEANGKHAIYVDMVRNGRREMGGTILVRNGGNTKVEINKSLSDKNGPEGESFGADFPMFDTLGSYGAWAYNPGEAGDGIKGLGLGEPDGNPKAHTAFGLTWTWTIPGTEGNGSDIPDNGDGMEARVLVEQLAQLIDDFRNAAVTKPESERIIYGETVNELQKAFAYFVTFGT